MRWTIPRSVLQEIEAHARDERPRECCGILIGLSGRVLESRRAANLSDDPNRFLVDPRTHVSTLRDTRRRELQIVGFYHSHPHSPPVPSPRDLAEASYPDLIHAIVSLQHERAETRVYRLYADHYDDVSVEWLEPPSPVGVTGEQD
jgi:proteasome lid subunit RPN8/RPN11